MTDNHLKRGFYQVGSKKYFSKFQAVLESQKTGEFPEWNFNDDTFKVANWSTEPTESIWELYTKRARQLREKHDYLVLLFSGGSDSTNILQSFLFNNIPIDEIICWGSLKSVRKSGVKVTRDPQFQFSEIDLVAIPYLKEMAKTHNFKLTIHDWTDEVINSFHNADWIWTDINMRFNPNQLARNKIHECSTSATDLMSRGKSVAFIHGIDKPRVILKDDVYYSAFLDILLNATTGFKSAIDGKHWYNDELFYWTPDLPELPIKMAYLIKNFFIKNPTMQYIIKDCHMGSWKHGAQYSELAKSLCYPYWNNKTFQVIKPNGGTLSETDLWFSHNDQIESRKHWLAGVSEVTRVIDSSWFNNGSIENDFIGSWSKWYKIG